MRALLAAFAVLAALGLGLLAWSTLEAAPAATEGTGGTWTAREDGRPGDGVPAGLDKETGTGAEKSLSPVASRLDGPDGRAAAEVEAASVGEHAAFVLALGNRDGEPVAGLTIERAEGGGRRLSRVPEARATGRPGLYEVRWPASSPSLDLMVEAKGYLPAAIGGLMPGDEAVPHEVRLERPASLAVHLTGYPVVKGGKVELFKRKDARRGGPWAERPWTGEGPVVFEDLPTGTFSLAAVVPGAPPAHLSSIELRAGSRTVVEIDAPRGEGVRGTVVAVGSERPVKGVKVELQPLISGLADREERAPFGEVVTGADGRFEFDGAPVGRAQVILSTEDGARVSREIVVIEGNGAREIKLRVRPSGSLAGRVVGPKAALAQLEVAVVAKGDARLVAGRAFGRRPLVARAGVAVEVSEAGTFTAEKVPAGRELLVIARRKDDGSVSVAEVTEVLKSGERREGVELYLRPPSVRQFQVTDRAGVPISPIEVAFEERIAGGSDWTGSKRLESASGIYQAAGLSEGARRIRVEAEGYTSVLASWTEGEIPIFELRGRRDVHVLVVGDHGRALPRARVVATAELDAPDEQGKRKGAPRARDGCDRFGRARLDLDPGFAWRVSVSAPGYATAGPFRVEPHDTLSFDAPLVVRLEPDEALEYAVVRGELVRFGTGGPLFDVEFDGLRGGTWRLDGTAFELRGLRPGRAKISARSPSFESVQLPLSTLEPGQEVDVGVLRVRPATRLEVTVKDHRGKRARKLRVRLQRLAPARGGRDDLPRRVELRENGKSPGTYASGGVGRAKWRLTVEQGGKRVHARVVDLKKARQRVEVRLPAPGGPGR